MDIQEIKNRYKNAYIEDFGDYEIVHVDKKELDWFIAQAEQLERVRKLSIAENLTLAEFAKAVLILVEGREIPTRKERS